MQENSKPSIKSQNIYVYIMKIMYDIFQYRMELVMNQNLCATLAKREGYVGCNILFYIQLRSNRPSFHQK